MVAAPLTMHIYSQTENEEDEEDKKNENKSKASSQSYVDVVVSAENTIIIQLQGGPTVGGQ